MAEIFDSNGVRLQQADPSDDVNDLLVTGFTFPDQGHVIPALVLKGTKDRVQGLNIQKSPESAEGVAIVKESGLGGQGLFATRALSTGELILSERPIMVTRAVGSLPYHNLLSCLTGIPCRHDPDRNLSPHLIRSTPASAPSHILQALERLPYPSPWSSPHQRLHI